ncbi:MAG: SRPBCC domain-containing protein [Pseudomonadota bacterium]|nr:SRPBCC domain-containing protein [Pseudomonadota bacterium]
MTSQDDPVAEATDKVLHCRAELAAPVREVFDHFTRPELLCKWLCATAHVDREIGGRYELFWVPDDPENNSTIGCRVTAWAPGELLAFHWRSPAQFKAFANVADPLTHVVVSFAPTARGCRVHLVHSGWRRTPDWEEARQWQARAWSVAFEQLEALWPLTGSTG